jgi:hypothetical protein
MRRKASTPFSKSGRRCGRTPSRPETPELSGRNPRLDARRPPSVEGSLQRELRAGGIPFGPFFGSVARFSGAAPCVKQPSSHKIAVKSCASECRRLTRERGELSSINARIGGHSDRHNPATACGAVLPLPRSARDHQARAGNSAVAPWGTMWRAGSRMIVERFIRRRAPGSNGSRRCIVKPLSHSNRSPTCQVCV